MRGNECRSPSDRHPYALYVLAQLGCYLVKNKHLWVDVDANHM